MMTCLIAPFITTARKDLRDLIVYIKLFDNFEEKKTLGGGDETQGGTELLRLYGTAVSFLSVLVLSLCFQCRLAEVSPGELRPLTCLSPRSKTGEWHLLIFNVYKNHSPHSTCIWVILILTL